MLAKIHSSEGSSAFRVALLAILTSLMMSCAHEETALITDPNSSRETALPWNEQQKWEREGSAAAQGLNTAGRR